MRRMWMLPATLLLAAGCEENLAAPAPFPCNSLLANFQAASGDTVQTAEGVRYIDLEVGTGEAAVVGGTVDVNYSLYTIDGDFQESSCEGAPVIRFLIGGVGVLDGFQIGVIGMREGGVRRVILPVDLGYPVGHPSGLGGQQLLFDIQLVDQF